MVEISAFQNHRFQKYELHNESKYYILKLNRNKLYPKLSTTQEIRFKGNRNCNRKRNNLFSGVATLIFCNFNPIHDGGRNVPYQFFLCNFCKDGN